MSATWRNQWIEIFVEHLAPAGDAVGQNDVEGRDPVGGDDQEVLARVVEKTSRTLPRRSRVYPGKAVSRTI